MVSTPVVAYAAPKEDPSLWDRLVNWITGGGDQKKESENKSNQVTGVGDLFVNNLIPTDDREKIGNVTAIYNKYSVSDYQLDLYVEDTYFWELIDKVSNGAVIYIHSLNNALWSLSVLIAKATVWARTEALTLDLVTSMSNSWGEGMQQLAGFDESGTIKSNGAIGLLLPFMVIFAGLWAGWQVYINDDDESAKRGLLTSAMVILLMFAFVASAAPIMQKINGFTTALRNVFIAIPTSMQDQKPTTIDEAIAISNNNVWKIMVHNDFLIMQWGTINVPDERVKAVLDHPQDSEARAEAVKKEATPKDEDGYGNVNMTAYNNFYRLAFILFVSIPKNVLIGGVNMILSAAIVLFQLLFVFSYYLGAIAIVWAVVPPLRENLFNWAAETLGAALMSFAIGVIMTVYTLASDLMYDYTANKGFLAIIAGQIIVIVMFWLKREQLVDWSTGSVMKVIGGMGNAQYLNRMMEKGANWLKPRRRRKGRSYDNGGYNISPNPVDSSSDEDDRNVAYLEAMKQPEVVDADITEYHPNQTRPMLNEPTTSEELTAPEEKAQFEKRPEPKYLEDKSSTEGISKEQKPEEQTPETPEPVMVGVKEQKPTLKDMADQEVQPESEIKRPVLEIDPHPEPNKTPDKSPESVQETEPVRETVPLEPIDPVTQRPKRPNLEVPDE